MSSEIKLADIDVDGAIRETAAEAGEQLATDGDTRAEFFRKAGIAGGAVIGGGALLSALVPGTAAAAKGGKLDAPPKSFGKGDIGILNYALTLEYLEAAFYNEAAKNLKLKGAEAQFLSVVVKDENAHVKFLEKALGKKAAAEPKFNFGDATKDEETFLATAFVLENTGVAAYAGQGTNIKDADIVHAALSIHSIEARHAGVVGQIIKGKKGIAPNGSFDEPLGASAILKAVKKTGFIVS